jgi:hypothetical protein
MSNNNNKIMSNNNNDNKFKNFIAYMGGSMFQITLDNPITSYRQLVQQYAKDSAGRMVAPEFARIEANRVFFRSPVSASLSGLTPRLFGATFKTAPKFGFFWGITALTGQTEPGILSAIGSAIFSSYCINPVRMIEKQQRIQLRDKGVIKSVREILHEASRYGYRPLFRGTTPLIGHSAASAATGLVGQPRLQKYIQTYLTGGNRENNGNRENSENSENSENNDKNKMISFSKSSANLIASALVSPIYVVMTNPLSRMEVIMQTNSIHSPPISIHEALGELHCDVKMFGLKGMFRGQGVGIAKAIISLSLFHEGRMIMEHLLK